MSRLRTRASRLSLRSRLVAGFSVATFVVLLAAGAFVYWRVDFALNRGLDTELAQAAKELQPLVHADGQVSNPSAADATGVAWQVLDAQGTVLSHGGAAGGRSMVTPRQISRVEGAPHTFDVGDLLPASHAPYRLLVEPTKASRRLYLLVGVRRDHRDEALRELLLQLMVAGVGTLAITAFVGERLARAALRPVERYRRSAAAIASGAGDLRLEVPPLRDDEVTRLGHTFNDMLAALERALDRERQFVNEASHELRTPITLLSSRLQLARRRPRSQAEHERILEELQVDLDRLARLAGELLALGRATAPGEEEAGDLAAVAARVVEELCRADHDQPLDVTLGRPTEAVPVRAAEFDLERILTNLVDNAAIHGASPVRLEVDRAAEAWGRLTVTDAGPGMPSSLLATATQRFRRADEARTRPGAGLGLALVSAFVERSGGELRLCYDGHHSSFGSTAPVPCTHGPAMTVTVLLPADTTGTARASDQTTATAGAPRRG